MERPFISSGFRSSGKYRQMKTMGQAEGGAPEGPAGLSPYSSGADFESFFIL